MSEIEARIQAMIDMLGFLEAPGYWKRMLACSLLGADVEATARGETQSGVFWFLPPNPEQVAVCTSKVGVGRFHFLRGVETEGSPMALTMVKMVLDRRTGGGGFVNETAVSCTLGWAVELPGCISRRLDELYVEFKAGVFELTGEAAAVVMPPARSAYHIVADAVANSGRAT